MRSVLALLLIVGLLLTGSPVFATSPSLVTSSSSSPCPVSFTTITGILSLVKLNGCYFVQGTRVDFGPSWYINTTIAREDYNNNGTNQTIVKELAGLVGTSVTLKVAICNETTPLEVFAINGLIYRDENAPPPWVQGRRGKLS